MTETPRDRRRLRRIAEDWRPSAELEEMTRLRDSDPEQYARTFGARGDILLGLHESGRDAARTIAATPTNHDQEDADAIFD